MISPSAQLPSVPDRRRIETPEEEKERRVIWANAMLTVARRTTANLAKMSPTERRGAVLQASVLTEVAQKLLSGKPMGPTILDSALRTRRAHC